MENEKRLIDANALQFEPDPLGGMNGVLCLGRSDGKTMVIVQTALKRMIDNAPTVDAVEVVRCKDCKHYVQFLLDNKECRCTIFSGCYDRPYPTEPDDFCSYGERRTE